MVRGKRNAVARSCGQWWGVRMDQQMVLALFDEQMRRNAQPDDLAARVERIGGVVRQVGVGADDWNGVVRSGLDEATADAAIAAQVDHFASLGREFEWKLYAHDTPADLSSRLLAAGFVSEPAETLMVADIKALGVGAEIPAGIRLEPVTDAAGVERAADVHEQAFGTSAGRLRHRLASQLRGRPETFSIGGRDGRRRAGLRGPHGIAPGDRLRQLVGWRNTSRVAGPRHLPGTGRPPGPHSRRVGSPLPADQRLRQEPPDPAAPGVRSLGRRETASATGTVSAAWAGVDAATGRTARNAAVRPRSTEVSMHR